MPSSKPVYPLRLSPEFREFLQRKAEEHGLSFNAFVVMMLTRSLGYRPLRRIEKALAGASPAREVPEVARNALCPCGSGKKFKRCHGERRAEG